MTDYKNTAVPQVSSDVQDRMIKFKPGGPSVEEARAAMLAAREPATTFKGTKVPSFVDAEANRGMGTGGNTPVNQVKQAYKDLLVSAHNKLASFRIPQGTRINLNRMREAGLITQPEVDALMAEANGAPPKEDTEEPAGPSAELIASIVDPIETVSAEPIRVAATPVVVEPERVPVEEPRKSVDTKHFTGQIYKDGKEWVAELTYKNGSGAEKFTAPSKDELMLKLVEGKGHATIKVRNTVENMKDIILAEHDTWDFFFKQVKEAHGISREQFDALPKESQAAIQDSIQSVQSLAFVEDKPDFYRTDNNFKLIAEYLNNRSWPLTFNNMQIAYKDLMREEVLEQRPAPTVVSTIAATPVVAEPPVASRVSAPNVAPVAEDSVPVVAPSAPTVSTAVAAAPTATVVRKRGATGLVPGSSSAVPSEPIAKTEEGKVAGEPSVDELKAARDAATRGDFTALKRIATAGRKYSRY